jgi:hypothetical protein
MRWAPRVLEVSLVVVALLAAACGGGEDSVAGTYTCGPEEDVLELGEDGTVTFTPQGEGAPSPEEGTWSVDGNSGVFEFTGFQDEFTIEGDRLTFAHAGSPENLVCTRAT